MAIAIARQSETIKQQQTELKFKFSVNKILNRIHSSSQEVKILMDFLKKNH